MSDEDQVSGASETGSQFDPDMELEDDDMGPGLHLETPEEIQRIQDEASNDPQTGATTPDPEKVKKKRKGREKLRSIWWSHFNQGDEKEDGNYDATCKYCGQVIQMGCQRSTTSMKNHIIKSCKKVSWNLKHKPDALQKMLQAGKAAGKKGVVAWVFNQMRVRKHLARMVIAHEYPFNIATHHYLKVFLSDLQPSFKLPCRNTIRQDCISVYKEEMQLLYDQFGKLDCKFSFTSDLWTCKGLDRGFMALTAHYIDDTWQLRKRTITFASMPSPHTGKHISKAIIERLVLWNMDKKVFCLVLDNASSNDVCIKEILKVPSIKNALPVQGEVFHQRCGCHILNLIVQDGLAVLSTEITMIRDAMKYIRHSQGRMEKFKLAVAQAKVPTKRKPNWDVVTRWNSTYVMLELALELKDAIKRYAALDRSFTYNPTESDWVNMRTLVDFLKIFYDATMKFSGSKYPTVNLFFPEFCEVCICIKSMESSPHPFVVKMGTEMYAKWDKYWTSGNMLLAMACVLDPRCKMHVVDYYVRQMYPDECDNFMLHLKNCINALFQEYVAAHSTHSQTSSSTQATQPRQTTSASAPYRVSEVKAGLKDFIKGKRVAEPTKSELEEYLADPLDEASLEDGFDILSWWKLKVPKYPILSKLTRDILAVPISTVAYESTFSTSGRTLNNVRSSLNDESLEALICAQNWLKASVAENGWEFGDVIWAFEDMDENEDDLAADSAGA